MALESGTRLGSYEIGEQLGKGGMGEVYRALDTRLRRTVAVKVLSSDLDRDSAGKERFQREARSIAALSHPRICTLFDIGSQDGIEFLVMEYLAGETLAARLAKGPVPLGHALQIASEVAEALEQAHERGIVHRDLKSANVMLLEDGHVKVMDFGLAKEVSSGPPDEAETVAPLTDAGVRVGTPGYMAPEQLLGGETDKRTDVFAFGILLYELLAGVHPFTRSSLSDTMSAILREPPPPLLRYTQTLPAQAPPMLDRLLAKEPRDRYPSFSEVRVDLNQLRDVGSTIPRPPTAEARPGPYRTPYVGRDSEREEVRRYLRSAVSGRGSLVLLGGEPGVGKTRLAEEMLAEAQQLGCLALGGHCYEAEGTPPFIPFVEILEHSARSMPAKALREALGDAAPEVARLMPELRRLFPDIPPPMELPAEQQRRYLFNSFLEFLQRACRISPHAVLLDDLHWADDSTLLLLEHLAPHLAQMPLLLVGTYRDVDLEVDRPFARTLEALTRQRLAGRVTLRRLDHARVGDLLAALAGQAPPADLVEAVFEETEGNPFFVEEVFHHLEEEGKLLTSDGQWRPDLRVESLGVPEGIRLVIGRRLQRLGEDHRSLLTMAAIIGRSFDLTLLEVLSDADEDAVLGGLEAAEAARLIAPISSGREPRWEFAHGLIRQTIEQGLSLRRRQRAHLRVADGLEQMHRGQTEPDAADIARHLYEAGAAADPDRTVRFLTIAGDQAAAAGAFDEALRRFTEALAVHEDADDGGGESSRLVADLQFKKGQALRSLDRTDEALEEWFRALEAYESLGDKAAIAGTAVAAGTAQLWGGDARVEGTVQRGLAALGTEPSPDRCRLLALLGRSQTWAGYTNGLEIARQAEAMATDIGDRGLLAEVVLAKSWAHQNCGQAESGVDVGLRAVEVYRESEDLWNLVEALSSVMVGAYYLADLDRLARLGDEAGPIAERIGHAGVEWCCGWARTMPDFLRNGDLETILSQERDEIERLRRTDFAWRFLDHLWLGSCLLFLGRWDDAQAACKEAMNVEPGGMYWTGLSSITLLLPQAYASTPGTAEEARAAAHALADLGDDNPLGRWNELAILVEALAVLGSRDAAAALYPVAAKGIQTGAVLTVLQRLWQMVAGIAAACGRQWEASEGHFENALRQAHELPHRVAQPEVRRWYAGMLIDRNAPGDRARARTLLHEARELYGALHMPKHLEIVQTSLGKSEEVPE